MKPFDDEDKIRRELKRKGITLAEVARNIIANPERWKSRDGYDMVQQSRALLKEIEEGKRDFDGYIIKKKVN